MNSRYTPLLIGLLIGIAVGLVFGWVIQPTEPGETSPHSLQEAYQADIVLMVAEIFAAEADIEMARQWMAALDLESDADVVTSTINFAKAHDFSDLDIDLLNNLSIHLKQATTQSETKSP